MRALLPFMIGEPLGLATAIFNVGQNQALKRPLNLLPANKLTNLSFKKKIPALLVSAVLFSVLPIPNIIKNASIEKNLTEELSLIKNALSTLQENISQNERLQDEFQFTDKFNKLVFQRNKVFHEKSFSCWTLQDFLNQLQSSLDHPDVSDAWFDELRFEGISNPKNEKTGNQKQRIGEGLKIILSGRYLVRMTETFSESENSQKRNHLIELNSQKQEALTQYLESLEFIKKVNKKTFSIVGEGDLFNRYFTHFKYEFLPKS